MSTIGFIGAGNMAEAIIKGILASGLYKAKDIMASDVRAERLGFIAKEYKIKTTLNNEELVRYASVVLICVKPQSIKKMLDDIEGRTRDNTLVISIAAGITTAYLAKRLSNCQIIRVMSNTPAMVGEGAAALFSANASRENLALANKLFSSVGLVLTVPREDLMDAVTAVSGSGPAYFFLLTEHLIEGAVRLGLDRETAEKLVLETAKGAALLALEAGKKGQRPAELRKKVTSPGGTTEAALKIFEERGFADVVLKALEAACERSKQLSSR